MRYAPTDLSNHLHCKHLTALDVQVKRGERAAPEPFHNASLEALKQKGIMFEQERLAQYKAQGLRVFELVYGDPDAERKTIGAMRAGYDVIYQARLKAERWAGWADFLLKVDVLSSLGNWSYEVWDTKLATTTKAATLLQIGLYTRQVAELQGLEPTHMGVLKPDGEDRFRYHDYAAYIRQAQRRLEDFLHAMPETYPDPVPFCDNCRWWKECNARRRQDDHLAFVAGLGRRQWIELRSHDIPTLEALANLPEPIPFRPERGSLHTFNRLRDQALLQYQSRRQAGSPLHKILPPEPGRGLHLLPEPSVHDIFLDFEGARMVEPDGLEYLIGYCYQDTYTALWACDESEEAANFEAFIHWAYQRWKENPSLHIYHYAPYETTAVKRLAGKYARCENEVDAFLRAGTFVDLYQVLRQTLMASVERYSLKDLEPFFGFQRKMDLRAVSGPKAAFEFLLEINRPEEAADEDRQVIRQYNEDDCRALPALRTWLENIRHGLVVAGNDIPRPEPGIGEANENITQHQENIRPLFLALQQDLPPASADRTPEQQARFVLSHFLDWYRREQKAFWWEYYRLLSLEPEERLDERKTIGQLEFTGESFRVNRSTAFRYRFPPQEIDLKEGELKDPSGQATGQLHRLDKDQGILEIRRGPTLQNRKHPDAVIQHILVNTHVKEASIIRFAEWVVKEQEGLSADRPAFRVGRRLLLRQPPQVPPAATGLDPVDHATDILLQMDGDYLAIQGPPGAGKSYLGSHLILRLVQKGKKVGITALSHQVITNLLQKTYDLARTEFPELAILQKGSHVADWTMVDANQAVFEQMSNHHIIAGTSFLWAQPGFQDRTVDYLFVDEAGQLALIDTVALAQATCNLVLLGDPNQLQQPQQGVHPAGTEVSALEHILRGQATIPADQGLFLATTWRMHPAVNQLVSELFYDGLLSSEPHLERQKLTGETIGHVGLAHLAVEHSGNTAVAPEETDAVVRLVAALTDGNHHYTDEKGQERILTLADIKVISPYNAQVNLLRAALPALQIGTVDKFQGQEAPVVIYSVASSSPDLAPRGMEFLYSPNRFNVAVSRAKVLFVLVSTAEIFEAEGKSPREMTLANSFARFRELALPLTIGGNNATTTSAL